MKRTIITLAAIGLLAVGCDTADPAAPMADGLGLTPRASGAGPVVHRASMGGADICAGLGLPPGCDANHSLIAMEFANGNVKGEWHDQFAGGVGFHVDVACLSVSGNEAWVSGTIRNDPFAGLNVIIRLQDNGQSGDMASFTASTANPNDCVGQPSLGLFALSNGQVKVK